MLGVGGASARFRGMLGVGKHGSTSYEEVLVSGEAARFRGMLGVGKHRSMFSVRW